MGHVFLAPKPARSVNGFLYRHSLAINAAANATVISAGRPGAVSRIERENEREAVRPEEYWTLDANLAAKSPPPFKARIYSYKDDRIDNKDVKLLEPKAREIVAACENAPFIVRKVERKEVRRSPAPPFITSRLQQEASGR